MDSPKMSTQFAPAERATPQEVQNQSQGLSAVQFLSQVFNAVPDILIVLNQERQIVYANRKLVQYLQEKDASAICGLRAGEALKCIHAAETPGGCGTTESCRMCGAVRATLSGLKGTTDEQECRIIQKDTGNALDFRALATPLAWSGRQFTVLSLTDISHEKRRKTLERLFFQDISNAAMGLRENAEVIASAAGDVLEDPAKEMVQLSNRLIEDITTQRILAAAESGELKVRPTQLNTLDLLREIKAYYDAHPLAQGRHIKIEEGVQDAAMVTEGTLLKLVLGHMVKNALEASGPLETVTLSAETAGKTAAFWVHNSQFMPREVQLQIFQRSFSTKGEGRGLGTYTMRLLSERYLHGNVTYSTSQILGTRFTASYPKFWATT